MISWRTRRSCNIRARNSDAAGKLEAALEAAQAFEPNDRRRAETRLALASIYFDQQRFADAEPHLLRAGEIASVDEKTNVTMLATILNALGLVYMHQNKFRRAELAYMRALQIFSQELGTGHARIADVLENIASLFLLQDRVAEAEDALQRALPIRAQAIGPDHPDLLSLLDSYSLVSSPHRPCRRCRESRGAGRRNPRQAVRELTLIPLMRNSAPARSPTRPPTGSYAHGWPGGGAGPAQNERNDTLARPR